MSLMIKIAITLAAFSLWVFTQKMLGRRQPLFKDRIGDAILNWTEKWSLRLRQSPKAANGLLITSSLVIDILGVYLIAQALFGPSIRPLLALILLFTLRQINQAVTWLPAPEGMIWHNPGVPSIFVTYGVANDLFFSGHTALAVLGALEISQLGGPLFLVLAIAIVIFEIGAVVLLRAHWTMDIFAGAITALWVHEIMGRFAPVADQWIASF